MGVPKEFALLQVVLSNKRHTSWLEGLLATHIYHNICFTFKALSANLVPCAVFVLLSISLFRALKRAQIKKHKLDETSHPLGLFNQPTHQPPNSGCNSNSKKYWHKEGILLFRASSAVGSAMNGSLSEETVLLSSSALSTNRCLILIRQTSLSNKSPSCRYVGLQVNPWHAGMTIEPNVGSERMCCKTSQS
ncbi:myoinhibitory peptide receptor 2 [Tropilaelaps mercedesae]|uniref:Myoinhibitory peptide receptor 2 n=1 Tax=Tropilaelaps mercedesae TaxID=418985 RepID=A0A1V9X7U5_9ACAR|nr:myoinhibitory peptide receptor 2 [Tropilaelaps mercedesae]